MHSQAIAVPRRGGAGILLQVCKIALAAAAAWYIFSGDRFDLRRLHVQPGRAYLIVLAGLALTLLTALGAVRWRLLLGALAVPLPLSEALRLSFLGNLFGTFLFGGVGGDVVRLSAGRRYTGRGSAVGASLLLDRVTGLAGLLVMATAALLLRSSDAVRHPTLDMLVETAEGTVIAGTLIALSSLAALTRGVLVGLGFIAVCACGGGAVLAWSLSQGAALRQAHVMVLTAVPVSCAIAALLPHLRAGGALHARLLKLPMGGIIGAVLDAVVEYHRHPGLLLAMTLLSGGMHALSLFAVVLIGIAVGHAASASQIFIAGPAAFLANMLPAPMGGLGVGEACFDAVLALCRDANGQPVQGGAMLFLAWRLVTNFVAVVGGLPIFLRGGSDQAERAG